jgi:hypothetical protein
MSYVELGESGPLGPPQMLESTANNIEMLYSSAKKAVLPGVLIAALLLGGWALNKSSRRNK